MLATKTNVVAAARPARAAVVVRASAQPSVDRRALLGLVAGGVMAALAAPKDAEAIRIPSQEFTGGLVVGGGASPKSPTSASMEGYTMEGTKKYGVSLKTKKKLLAKARADAQKTAS